jgi:biopolymer transport protein TolR
VSLGRLERNNSKGPMSDINMTPLIDVMLVLLVIFIITAPLMASRIQLELPKADVGTAPEAQHLEVSITADGTLFLKDEKLNLVALSQRFIQAAQANKDTEVHLRADSAVPYGTVAQVMAAAQKSGLSRIGFVTDPSSHSGSNTGSNVNSSSPTAR